MDIFFCFKLVLIYYLYFLCHTIHADGNCQNYYSYKVYFQYNISPKKVNITRRNLFEYNIMKTFILRFCLFFQFIFKYYIYLYIKPL